MLPTTLFIPLCPSSTWNHNELRLALRSWEKHGPPIETVLIIGHKPDWLQDVHHIPFTDRWNKPTNIYEKVKLAAKLYDSFIFANDDHFLLRRMVELPYYRSVKLKEFKGGGETFMRYVEQTRQLFPDGYYFDVHTPMVVHAHIVESLEYRKDVLFKSLYCNSAQVWGEEFKDCKIKDHMRREDIERYVEGRPFLSTGEAISNDLKKWLFDQFPEKSRWEL
jgi:hypothetical protein